jgi:hypothetical protein
MTEPSRPNQEAKPQLVGKEFAGECIAGHKNDSLGDADDSIYPTCLGGETSSEPLSGETT